MARQCTQPKRRRDATWFKEKVLLVQVRAEGKELDEEQLSFLADPGVVDGQVAQMIFQILYRSFIPNEECNGKSRVAEDFGKRFVPQQELSSEQKFWLQSSDKNSEEPSTLNTPVKIEVPNELPRVSLVNKSLKKLRFHLASFDKVVKVRTTPDAIIEGPWDFEHTKKVFLTEISPWLNKFKDFFNEFDKGLFDEITEVQTVFTQMEAAVKQCSVDRKCCEIQHKFFLIENDRLLDKIISQEIVNIVLNSSVIFCDSEKKNEKYVDTCNKCLELETEFVKNNDVYIELSKRSATSKGHCHQQTKGNNSLLRENTNPAKVKKDIDEIETINIELEHSVTKLLSENEKLHKEREHLKKTYKELYDSIKLPSEKLVAVTPKNKDKKVRFADPVTSSSNTQKQVDSYKLKDSNQPLLHSTGVIGSTSASGSKPIGNTKNNRISQSSSSNKTNKVEDQPRSVKSRKNKKNRVVKTECNAHVMQSHVD
ncbi:hypothetical protein Tco_1328714 [Tanacetum coccineum]